VLTLIAHEFGGTTRCFNTRARAALLRCSPVKKLLLLLVVLGVAFIAAKKIRST
jgi:hypothetical protein